MTDKEREEEERLQKFLDRRSAEAFEKKRKEELRRYEEKTGKHVNLELHDHAPHLHFPHPGAPAEATTSQHAERHEHHHSGSDVLPVVQEIAESYKHSLESTPTSTSTATTTAPQHTVKVVEVVETPKIQQLSLPTESQPQVTHGTSTVTAQPQHHEEETTRVCSSCHHPFASITDIYVVDDKKYCKACSGKVLREKTGHFDGSFDGHGKCAACGNHIDGTCVKASNRKYHPACLTCAKCKTNLVGKGFRPRGKELLCTDCSGGFGFRGI